MREVMRRSSGCECCAVVEQLTETGAVKVERKRQDTGRLGCSPFLVAVDLQADTQPPPQLTQHSPQSGG